MNDAIKNIMTRRSTREFKKEQISDKDLETILECARYAPSGIDTQPWHFVVVQNRELIEEMSKLCFRENKKKGFWWYQDEDYYSPFYDAPTVIFVLKELDKSDWINIDCSLATENIVLAANALGLGSCILADAMTLFDEKFKDEYYKKLHIREGYAPHIAVSIGYSNDELGEKEVKRDNVDIIK